MDNLGCKIKRSYKKPEEQNVYIFKGLMKSVFEAGMANSFLYANYRDYKCQTN